MEANALCNIFHHLGQDRITQRAIHLKVGSGHSCACLRGLALLASGDGQLLHIPYLIDTCSRQIRILMEPLVPQIFLVARAVKNHLCLTRIIQPSRPCQDSFSDPSSLNAVLYCNCVGEVLLDGRIPFSRFLTNQECNISCLAKVRVCTWWEWYLSYHCGRPASRSLCNHFMKFL